MACIYFTFCFKLSKYTGINFASSTPGYLFIISLRSFKVLSFYLIISSFWITSSVLAISRFYKVWIFVINSNVSESVASNFRHLWIFIGFSISSDNALTFNFSSINSLFKLLSSYFNSYNSFARILYVFISPIKIAIRSLSFSMSSNLSLYYFSPFFKYD